MISNILNILNNFIDRIVKFLENRFYIRKILRKSNLYIKINRKIHYLRLIRFNSQFIKKNDLCFDIGANVGEKTKVFFKLGAKVISVEPQKRCLQKLYEQFGKNKNVVIIGKAVGEEEGFGKLYIAEHFHPLTTLSDKWTTDGPFAKRVKYSKTQKVPITTLDNLIQLYGIPKFIKIDVEGYEVEVIKGLTQKIPYLCFEVARNLIDNLKACLDHLLSIGPYKTNFVIGEKENFYLSRWVSSKKLTEVLNSLGDKLIFGDIYVKFL